jgi:uncharacterized membrane protein
MNLNLPDWKSASIAALALLGIAAFVVFVIHPGGFEGQIGWFFGLLPGAAVGAVVSDRVYRVYRVTPVLEPLAEWGSIVCVSFLWYFVISYGVIKAFRLVSRGFNSW